MFDFIASGPTVLQSAVTVLLRVHTFTFKYLTSWIRSGIKSTNLTSLFLNS